MEGTGKMAGIESIEGIASVSSLEGSEGTGSMEGIAGTEGAASSKSIAILANDTSYTYNLRDQVLEALHREGYALYLVAEKLHYVEELEGLGVQCVHVDTERHNKGLLANGRLLAAYFRILRKLRPDLVLTYNIKPDVYGGLACRLLGIPYLATVTGLGTALERPGALQRFTCLLYRFGLGRAGRVVFQNPDNRDFFLDRHLLPRDGGDWMLVPGSGVNLAKYPLLPYPDPSEGKEGREVHFLFIARILREKGIVPYLHAAKCVRALHPEAVFHILGPCDDPRYLGLIQRYVAGGDVLYHGEQEDLRPYYAMASCLIHPSWYPEGISNVLLEAASSGRPVISTARSGCREMVEDGVTGYLVPPGNQEALHRAVLRFLSLSTAERREMGRRGREKVAADFDRRAVAESYLAAVRDLLSERGDADR